MGIFFHPHAFTSGFSGLLLCSNRAYNQYQLMNETLIPSTRRRHHIRVDPQAASVLFLPLVFRQLRRAENNTCPLGFDKHRFWATCVIERHSLQPLVFGPIDHQGTDVVFKVIVIEVDLCRIPARFSRILLIWRPQSQFVANSRSHLRRTTYYRFTVAA